MYAVIGLGNPGKRYELTRHNVGFWVVDYIYSQSGKEQAGLSWKRFEEVDTCLVARSPEPMMLLKPLKYMNLSGEAVQPVLHFYKINPKQVIVIHDDIDLPCGQLRIREGRKSGGHRGVQNMIDMLGGSDFARIRIGVGRPGQVAENTDAIDPGDWVIGKPSFIEEGLLREAVQKAAEALNVLINDGLIKAQNRFNTKVEN
ncbi:MAG: aminoacyl-tRNA hydrolase [Deltaproteobacteria bacterium]|nr:aminoacyl-tRNA hydrolase [Deltaproteobacteria bacterium]